MGWKLVWQSDVFEIKPKFQPHIQVLTDNLDIPTEAEAGSVVYVGEIDIKGLSDTPVKVRVETVVDGQVVHYQEWDDIKLGRIVGYIGKFTMPNKTVKVQLKVYEWVNE